MKDQCTKKAVRIITIGKHYKIVKEVKEYNKTKKFKEDMKLRSKIDPKQGEMKRFHGLARAKCWSLPKVNIRKNGGRFLSKRV